MEGRPRMPSEETPEGSGMTPEDTNLENTERVEPDLHGAAEEILEQRGETGIEVPVISVGDEAQEDPEGGVLEGEALDNALREALHGDDARFEQNVQIETGEIAPVQGEHNDKYVLHEENGARVWRKNNGDESTPIQEGTPDAQNGSEALINDGALEGQEEGEGTPIDADAEKAQEPAVSKEEVSATPESIEREPGSLAVALEETAQSVVAEKQERMEEALSPEQIATPEYAKKAIDHELARLGINPEDIAKDEAFKEFNELSDGQKLLVARDLNRFAFSESKIKAHEEFNKRNQEEGVLNVKRIARNVFRNVNIASYRKAELKKAMAGGVGMHGETLKVLAEKAKIGPEVEIDSAGNLNVQYAKLEGLSAEEQKVVRFYNKVAGNYGRTPAEWGNKSATNEQKMEYWANKEEYNRARKELLALKEAKSSSEDAMQYVNSLDALVTQDQFLNTVSGEKLEESMQRAATGSALWQGWKETITERGMYAAVGAGTRFAVVGALGIAAVPVMGATVAPVAVGAIAASALVGRWIGRRRMRQTLDEKEMLRRHGDKASEEQKNVWKDKLAKTTRATDGGDIESYKKGANERGKILEKRYAERGITVSAEALDDKLGLAFAQFEKEEDPKKRSKALVSLRARIGYTQDKIDKGEVNFGNGVDQLKNQLDLIQGLSRARAHSVIEDPDVKKELDEKMGELTKYQGHMRSRVEQAEKKRINAAGRTGALIAATFTGASYAITDFVMSGKGANLADNAKEFAGHLKAKLPYGLGDEELHRELESSAARVYNPGSENGSNLWNMIEHDLRGDLKGLEGHERDAVIMAGLNKFRELTPEQLKEIGFSSASGENNVENILKLVRPTDRINFSRVYNTADLHNILGRMHAVALEKGEMPVPATGSSVVAESATSSGTPTAPAHVPSGGKAPSVSELPSSAGKSVPPEAADMPLTTQRAIPSEPKGNGSIFSTDEIEKYRGSGGGKVEQVAYTPRTPQEIVKIPSSDFERQVIYTELNNDVNLIVPGGARGANWMYVKGESVERLMNTRLQAPRAGYVPQQRSPWSVSGRIHIGGRHSASQDFLRIEHRPTPPPPVYRGPLPVGLRSPETVANLQSYINALEEQSGLSWRRSGYSVERYIYEATKVSGRMNNVPGFGDNPIPGPGGGLTRSSGWSQAIAENMRNNVNQVPNAKVADEFVRDHFNEFTSQYYSSPEGRSDADLNVMLQNAYKMRTSLNELNDKFGISDYQARSEQIEGIITKLERQTGASSGAPRIVARVYEEKDLTPSSFSKLEPGEIKDILNVPVGEEEGKEVMKNVADEVNKIFQTNGAPKNGFDYGEGIGNMSADWEDMKGRTIDEILHAKLPTSKIVDGKIIPPEEGVGIHSTKFLTKVRAELIPKLEYQSGLPAHGPTTLEDYIKDAHVLIKRGPDFKPE